MIEADKIRADLSSYGSFDDNSIIVITDPLDFKPTVTILGKIGLRMTMEQLKHFATKLAPYKK